jgi:4-hydroxy-3-methylbut-2-enyl diphosphate reductase
MELIIAHTAGFCMGVDLALHKLDRVLDSRPAQGRIHTLGPIIHNPQVLQRYRELGVLQVESMDDLQSGDVVVIRAHGIPRTTQEELHARNVEIVDATCPKVKKAQILIQGRAEHGGHLLLFGERDHPEVRGLLSYAPEHTIFESLEELAAMHLPSKKNYFLAAQTTQDRDAFTRIHTWVRNNLSPEVIVLDTICDATKDRQEEVRHLARTVEAMIVVGGKNSGNTRRLAQIAQEADVYTVHVETGQELDLEELAAFFRIGLTAGASTPDWIIQDVVQTLRRKFDY